MKKNISLSIIMLALIASNAHAFFNCCDSNGSSDHRSWFFKPKIGVAPSIFARNRAHQFVVVPWAGVDQTLCDVEEPAVPQCNVNNYADVLQETQCLPKFSDMFNQGVLHVGFELGHLVCENTSFFLEFVYNRASGKCFNYAEPFITNRALASCTADCTNNSNTNNSCNNDCTRSGDTLSDIVAGRDDYSNYQAYGGYIGSRHFTNRFWCDSTAFWVGAKVGILHRKRIDSASSATIGNLENCAGCTTDTLSLPVNRAIFCASNSVSGGIQAGFDYDYNDCFGFQIGFEVVASCGLVGNRNRPIDLSQAVCGENSLIGCAKMPSNVLVSNTGHVVNFPIWFGLRWSFGGCDSCSTPCN